MDVLPRPLAFRKNSLRRRRCCKPTAHCNNSSAAVDLLEKLSLRLRLSVTKFRNLTAQISREKCKIGY